MSLQTRLSDFITAVGTDYKQLRTWITGSSTGTLSGLTTTSKTSVVSAINEVNSKPVASAATETVAGIAEIATQTEINDGVDDTRIVTPQKFINKLTAYAQPLAANLTALAGQASTAFGRARLNDADAPAARTALGLATIASTGSASDITGGMLPSSVMPPLAITETYVVGSQAEQLALAAQRGDVAIRTDLSRSFILATDSPGTLADWKQLTAGGDVISVAGKTGTVLLVKGDVGLANVDNTTDLDKPISNAQAATNALMLRIANNLSDVANVATARTNLDVYSKTELGNPETDLVALYTTAKA